MNGAFIYACLLLKPDLRLRLHATQAQPCFPAASNALALPGGNGIFTATPTELYNTLHFASQSRVAKWGRCPLWKPPQGKAVRYPSTGRIPPFLVIQPSGCIG